MRVERKRLRRRIPLLRHIAFRDRTFFDRPDRLPGDAIEHVKKRLLGGLRHRFDRAAVDDDVGEDRRVGDVVVPDAVMDQLEMPLALAGLQIDRHEALAEEAGARPIRAEVVTGGKFDGQIGDAELFVDADLSPRAGIARVRPRVVQPGVVPEFARPRDRVKDPEPLARAHVESADVALHVGLPRGNAARFVRGADDDNVFGNHRRRVQADLRRHRIDHLVIVLFQIDEAVFAKRRDAHASLRVERDELISRRHVENSLLASIGPVREAAARELPGRRSGAGAFAFAVHPQLFACFRIERDNRAPAAAGCIQHAVHHQRGALVIEFRPRSEMVGLEPPRHGELAEVVGGDLIERRVARMTLVAPVGRPFAVFGAGLSVHAGDRPAEGQHNRDERN